MRLQALRQVPLLDRLLFLLSGWTPKLHRVLLIESGSRRAAARFLEQLYKNGETQHVDVLTCYNAAPETFNAALGDVVFTHHARGAAARRQLFRDLTRSQYSAVCLLCTGDDIMTRWKWVTAARIPAKVMLVNESADCFWLDRGHWRDLKNMLIERSGIRHMAPLRSLGQSLAFPFVFLFLLAFAGYMHARRILIGQRVARQHRG